MDAFTTDIRNESGVRLLSSERIGGNKYVLSTSDLPSNVMGAFG